MKIHEYQAKELLAAYGVPVPEGLLALTPEEAKEATEKLGGQSVVKAQVHCGGRGKAGGVKLAKSPEEAFSIAQNMLDRKERWCTRSILPRRWTFGRSTISV